MLSVDYWQCCQHPSCLHVDTLHGSWINLDFSMANSIVFCFYRDVWSMVVGGCLMSWRRIDRNQRVFDRGS